MRFGQVDVSIMPIKLEWSVFTVNLQETKEYQIRYKASYPIFSLMAYYSYKMSILCLENVNKVFILSVTSDMVS